MSSMRAIKKGVRPGSPWIYVGVIISLCMLGIMFSRSKSGHQEQRSVLSASEAGPPEASSDRHAIIKPTAETAKHNPELAKFLAEVAINNEVLMAVSNKNLAHPGDNLDIWIRNIIRVGVKNAFVWALDDETQHHVEKWGLKAYRADVQTSKGLSQGGNNHATSALKFRILRDILPLGYSVLMADVDIVTLRNPFEHIERDSDLEGMSDGWEPRLAYGYNHVDEDKPMGWARFTHSMRVFVMNSGLFYIRPTQASLDLLEMIIDRLDKDPKAWDQAVFNECIFFPSSPGHKDPSVTRRIMDIDKFMGSKRLFKTFRHAKNFNDPDAMPVMIHVNAHPSKKKRLEGIERRWVKGDIHALDSFSLADR